MRQTLAVVILGLAVACASAQQIPAGTLLPAMLDGTIDSNDKPGKEISAKLMQEVVLPSGEKIKRESKVLGQVTAVSLPSHGHPATLSVKFDRIEIDKQSVPISTGLRALATMQSVSKARMPVNANSGYGTSPWDWNMLQVGGQAAFNGQKIVKSQTGQVVGKVLEPGAVVGVPMANPIRGCPATPESTAEQAFWVFSTDACGVYGDKNLKLDAAPTSGVTTITSTKKITVRGGSGLLIQVNASSSTAQ